MGDFHNVQYADQSLDVVFTNSFDHVFYPEKILQEIQRVLKPQGRFISDFAAGNNTQGTYESFSWSNIEDLITLVEKHGFKLIHQENIDYPFKNGSFVIFEKLN